MFLDDPINLLLVSFESDFRHRPDDKTLNCSLPGILEFPNFMRRKSWWIAVLCTFFSLYLFVILAIVCDDYLLPAMERLCYALKLSYDVAGASFLAITTSAPELFINCVGTFITFTDIGVGTIVGSSVFNILVIAAVCGLLTDARKVQWWPVTRDIIWYLVAILSLVTVMWKGYVHWYEGLILLLLYVVYFIQLLFDKRIKKLFVKSEENETEQPAEMSREKLDEGTTFRSHVWGVPEKGSKCWAWLWWLFKYPVELCLALTIPNPRKVYPLTLIMSVVWISLVSYFVTWFITVVGYNMGVPDSIMGLTFLAAGTSIPEVVSSYIVSRQGHSDMAICNAVASNTVDIFICLGLPWCLKAAIWDVVRFNSESLSVTTAMLVLTAFTTYITLASCRFVLGKIVGWVCLVGYVIFISLSCLLEMLPPVAVICDIEKPGFESYLAG